MADLSGVITQLSEEFSTKANLAFLRAERPFANEIDLIFRYKNINDRSNWTVAAHNILTSMRSAGLSGFNIRAIQGEYRLKEDGTVGVGAVLMVQGPAEHLPAILQQIAVWVRATPQVKRQPARFVQITDDMSIFRVKPNGAGIAPGAGHNPVAAIDRYNYNKAQGLI